ncbi:hypothetical protein KCP73_17425 [Salmonella enterica subsp. enterica]|nr:hypothetical protein KCP73_17425 [Salmonella enterica subsp. enterica]
MKPSTCGLLLATTVLAKGYIFAEQGQCASSFSDVNNNGARIPYRRKRPTRTRVPYEVYNVLKHYASNICQKGCEKMTDPNEPVLPSRRYLPSAGVTDSRQCSCCICAAPAKLSLRRLLLTE